MDSPEGGQEVAELVLEAALNSGERGKLEQALAVAEASGLVRDELLAEAEEEQGGKDFREFDFDKIARLQMKARWKSSKSTHSFVRGSSFQELYSPECNSISRAKSPIQEGGKPEQIFIREEDFRYHTQVRGHKR